MKIKMSMLHNRTRNVLRFKDCVLFSFVLLVKFQASCAANILCFLRCFLLIVYLGFLVYTSIVNLNLFEES